MGRFVFPSFFFFCRFQCHHLREILSRRTRSKNIGQNQKWTGVGRARHERSFSCWCRQAQRLARGGIISSSNDRLAEIGRYWSETGGTHEPHDITVGQALVETERYQRHGQNCWTVRWRAVAAKPYRCWPPLLNGFADGGVRRRFLLNPPLPFWAL